MTLLASDTSGNLCPGRDSVTLQKLSLIQFGLIPLAALVIHSTRPGGAKKKGSYL